MEASKRNLTADRGSLYELAIRWVEDGVPVDLTGWTGAMVVTTRADDPDELVRVAADLDSSGNIVCQIDPDDLPEKGSYAWHLEMVEGSLPPRYLMIGLFTVRSAADV